MIEYIAMAVAAIVIIVVCVLGRKRLCPHSQSASPGRSYDDTPENTQLYVGNVSYRIGEPEIEAFFAKFGEIATVKLIKDRRTGRSKGFAFVTFKELSAAKKAISSHGEDLAGRPMTVRYAKPA